jgi:hypothetical protein
MITVFCVNGNFQAAVECLLSEGRKNIVTQKRDLQY